MPSDVFRKGIATAFLIHICFFILLAVPSGITARKRILRVSLYSVPGTSAIRTEATAYIPHQMGETRGEESREKNLEPAPPAEGPAKEEKKIEEKERKGRKEKPEKKAERGGKTPVKKETKASSDGGRVSSKKEEPRAKGSREKEIYSQHSSGKEMEGPVGSKGTGSPSLSDEDGGIASVPDDLKTQYGSSLWSIVKERWAVISSMKGKNLKAEVFVKIAPDGEIIERKIEKSSGSSAFDALALRVIDEVGRFPPVPWKAQKPLEILFLFSSE